MVSRGREGFAVLILCEDDRIVAERLPGIKRQISVGLIPYLGVGRFTGVRSEYLDQRVIAGIKPGLDVIQQRVPSA